ncbi:MAG: type 4a pilus biogenesis protein PilO [Patescibacteria group bacterium]
MDYRKNKNFITIGSVVIVLLAVAAFIIYPNFIEISKINQEITSERLKLEQKLNSGMNLRKIKTDLTEIKETINQLESVFVKKNHELEFFTQLENLASQNGLLINLNPDLDGKDLGDGIKQIPLQINLVGEYPQLLGFLRSVENLPYYYNLDLLLASTNSKNANQNITLQLIGSVYLK